MENLSSKKCVPCEGGAKPLDGDSVDSYLEQVDEWSADKGRTRISKKFSFNDFKEAIQFVNSVANISEEEGHHPDVHIHYNKVLIELWTHAVGGLSENDFIIAAKIDKIS